MVWSCLEPLDLASSLYYSSPPKKGKENKNNNNSVAMFWISLLKLSCLALQSSVQHSYLILEAAGLAFRDWLSWAWSFLFNRRLCYVKFVMYSGTGAGFSLGVFGFPLLINLLPVLHIHLLLPLEVTHGPDQAAHYLMLGLHLLLGS